jgi:hypothetical protein
MPRLTVFGHPVHPILQAIPASLLPASTTFDVLARLGIDEEGFCKAAHYSLVFGLLGEVGAATTGLLDYYEIENRPVRRIALYHGLTNATLVLSHVASSLRRKDRKADDTALALFAQWERRSSGSPATSGASWSTSTGCGWAKTTTAYQGHPRRGRQAMRKEMSIKC